MAQEIHRGDRIMQEAEKKNAAKTLEPPEFKDSRGYHPSAYRRPEYLEYLEKATLAMRTIRLVVYVGMAGFVLLSVYGFYLIYQLTADMHKMVNQSVVMSQQMQAMTRIMTNLDGSVADLDQSVMDMKKSVSTMNGSLSTMSTQLGQMGNTVALMQHSARNLDQSIGPAMGTFNRMVPFNWMGSQYGGAPPYAGPVTMPQQAQPPRR
ncbi:MAG TPA: hypothetical protein PKE19_02955 [Aestuariivirga sp.]|nr:hypothetical protein [Aestuariivirga sp.]